MGAIEDLALALSGPQQQQEIAAANPYLNLAKVPDSLPGLEAGIVARNPQQYGWGEALVPSIASGLLSGFLHGQGDVYSGELTSRFQNAAAAAANGQAPDPNAYLPPSLLTAANNAGSMFKLRSGLENQQLDINAGRQLKNEIALQTDPTLLDVKNQQADIAANRQLDRQLDLDTNPKALAAKVIEKQIAAGEMTLSDGLNKMGQISSGTSTAAPLTDAGPLADAAPSEKSPVQQYAEARGVTYTPGMTRQEINQIKSDELHNSEPLPDSMRKVTEAAMIAKDSASRIYPVIQKLEQSLTPDQQNLSFAEIKAQKLLPVNDITLLQQELPVLAQNISNANPTGRVPKAEIDKLTNAFSPDSTIAAGAASQRIKDYVDAVTGSLQKTLQNNYQGTKYANNAKSYLENNADLFTPLSSPLDTPAGFLAQLKASGTDAATARALYNKKFGGN